MQRAPERASHDTANALLRLDEEKSGDGPTVIQVWIQGNTVGYLAPTDAKAFHARLKAEGVPGIEFPCRARIHRSRDQGADARSHYGVWLDVCLYD